MQTLQTYQLEAKRAVVSKHHDNHQAFHKFTEERLVDGNSFIKVFGSDFD